MTRNEWHKIEHTKENRYMCCSCGSKIINFAYCTSKNMHFLCKKCYGEYKEVIK
jgi:ribosomal protein L37AE/L43A